MSLYQIIHSLPGFTRSQVVAELSESFNRRTDGDLEPLVLDQRAMWDARRSDKLFPGRKFRLHSCQVRTSPIWSRTGYDSKVESSSPVILNKVKDLSRQTAEFDGGNPPLCVSPRTAGGKKNNPPFNSPPTDVGGEGGSLLIRLGLTDYFDYLSTNHPPNLNPMLIAKGIEKHNDPDVYLSNALGNVGLIQTADNKIVLLERGGDVVTYQGCIDTVGGHPEPDNLNDLSSDSIVAELFDSIVEEVVEEINIPRDSIRDVLLLGFVRSLEEGRKPDMIFTLPVSLTSAEVEQYYNRIGNQHPEAHGIIFVEIDSLRRYMDDQSLKLTALARGSLHLFSNFLTGR